MKTLLFALLLVPSLLFAAEDGPVVRSMNGHATNTNIKTPTLIGGGGTNQTLTNLVAPGTVSGFSQLKSSGNTIVSSGNSGAVIAGSGNIIGNDSPGSFILGGATNYANGDRAFIIGASYGTNLSDYASGILGGRYNFIGAVEVVGLLAGAYNRWEGGDDGVIAGGLFNTNADGDVNAIIGGAGNYNAGLYGSVIAGGKTNKIFVYGNAFIAASTNSMVVSNASGAIIGGKFNKLAAQNTYIIGDSLTNASAQSFDVGFSDTTKTTFGAAGTVFRGNVTNTTGVISSPVFAGDGSSLTGLRSPIRASGSGSGVQILIKDGGNGTVLRYDEDNVRFEFDSEARFNSGMLGSGSGLTALNASQLTSGHVPTAALPIQVVTNNGAFTGKVPVTINGARGLTETATTSSQAVAGDGSAITFGSGLSLSGGTLTASATGTDPRFTSSSGTITAGSNTFAAPAFLSTGAGFTGNGGGLSNLPAQGITGYGPINVVTYGADPTGASDSTVAFANALVAAGNPATNSVYVPSGTFLVSGPIYIRGGRLFGDGGKSIIKQNNLTNSSTLIIATNPCCEIVNVRLFGSVGDQTTAAGAVTNTGIIHGSWAYGRVQNCVLEGFKTAVSVIGDTDTALMTKSALYLGNQLTNNGFGFYFNDNNAAEYVLCQGNNIHQSYTAIYNKCAGNVNIIGNVCVKSAWFIYDQALSTSAKANSFISGNTFNHGAGIRLIGNGMFFTDNNCQSTSDFMIAATSLVMTHNHLLNAAGIYIDLTAQGAGVTTNSLIGYNYFSNGNNTRAGYIDSSQCAFENNWGRTNYFWEGSLYYAKVPFFTNGAVVLSGGSLLPIGGTLKVNTTTTGNVGAGTDDLISFSIPAGVLATNGQYLEFDVWGSCAANTNPKDITVVYGGTTLIDGGAVVLNGVSWKAHGKIIRTGAATQTASCELTVGGTLLSAVNGTICLTTSPTETLSGAVTFKCTGTSTVAPADNDIVQNAMVLKVGRVGN